MNEKVANFYRNYVVPEVEQREFKDIQPGNNIPCVLINWSLTDSHHEFDGETLKSADKMPIFADASPEVAFVFKEVDGEGTIVTRAHPMRFRRFSELTQKEVRSGKFVESDEGYACWLTKEDKMHRMFDVERDSNGKPLVDENGLEIPTEKSSAYMGGILQNLGLKPGQTVFDLGDVVKKNVVLLDVVATTYKGVTRNDVKKIKPFKASMTTLSPGQSSARLQQFKD